MMWDRTKTHADQLPALRAANEAARAERGPMLKATQARKDADRAEVTRLLMAGADAVSATDEQRALIARLTGFSL